MIKLFWIFWKKKISSTLYVRKLKEDYQPDFEISSRSNKKQILQKILFGKIICRCNKYRKCGKDN